MAWTSPRTWVAAEVITAALFNTHIRDNLLALSGHGHSGAAGDGAMALASLSTVDLADQSGSPAQAGRLQRNGAVLEYYNSAVVYPGEADGITSHGSLRTLGSGAQQAAAGDHTHSPTSVDLTTSETLQTPAGSLDGAVRNDATTWDDNPEVQLQAATPTWAGSNRSRILVGALSAGHRSASAETNNARLYIDGVEVAEDSRPFSGIDAGVIRSRIQTVTYIETNATSGETVALKVQADATTTFYTYGNVLTQRVVKA